MILRAECRTPDAKGPLCSALPVVGVIAKRSLLHALSPALQTLFSVRILYCCSTLGFSH